jgi:hypothetical protein
MRKFTKHLAVAAVSVAALALSACIGSGSNPASSDDSGFATVVLQTKTSNVNRLSKPGLGKSAKITLDSLYVTAISNAATPDTVRVKLAVGDSGFVDTATIDQNISITLNLKALRNWTITARTVDVNDSVVQSGSVAVNNLYAGQVRVVNLVANANYKIYTSRFNMPDSIFSPTGNFGQNITLNKIEMLVDGVVKDDSVATLAPSTNYDLSFDYVSLTADSVTLKVYGNISNADAPYNAGTNLLYSKTVAVSSLVAVYPAVNTVALDWKGPVIGHASLTVQVQKVGQIAISATTDPVILSKK